MSILIMTAVAAVVYGVFHLGKHHERVEWNKLIEEGKLPRPGERKK